MINMGASASELPRILGISPAGMRSLLDLLVLLPEAQELVRNGEVSPSAAIEITRKAKQESSNPVAASTKATEKVLTLAKKAKESGAKPTAALAKAIDRQEQAVQVEGDKELKLTLEQRRQVSVEAIEASLPIIAEGSNPVLSRIVKGLVSDAISKETLVAIIKILSADPGSSLDDLERSVRSLSRIIPS